MWRKSKEETTTEYEMLTPAQDEPEVETRRSSVASYASHPSRAEAGIGKSVIIKGQIFSQEDLHLDGQIEGTLDLPANRLTVGQSGKIQANIRAREVDILGTVHGNIETAEKVTIRRAANLIGDLKCAAISIEDGAYFKGSIDIVRPVATKAVVSAPAAAPTQANAAQMALGEQAAKTSAGPARKPGI